MDKIAKTEVILIQEPSSRWEVSLEYGQLFPEVNSIYDSNKIIFTTDYHVSVEFDKLIIDFGFEEYSGYVKYSWLEYIDSSNNTSSCSTQPVSITINNDCDESNNNSNIITKTIMSNDSIKIGELSDESLFIEYYLEGSTKSEVGKIMVVNNTIGFKYDTHRVSVDNDLSIDIIVTKSDGLYLTLSNILEATTLRYTINKL